MRTLAILLAGSLLMGVTERVKAAEGEPGKQVACQLKVKIGEGDTARDATIRYWLFLPADYEKKDTWPLMVFLHGAGERGDDLEVVKKWGPPKIVAEKTDFPFVLVSPQCSRGARWSTEEIMHLTDHVAGTLKIDNRRMVITGLSMGGYGTWSIIAKYPKLFAAAAPICGGSDPATANKIGSIPIWAFHGDKDSVVPLRRSQEMVDAVKEAGGNAKLTVYPGVNHNSWSATYANPELYKWLLSHQR